jgi:RES domain-containing protein
MFVYRIAVERFANEIKGEGARLFGGRWNPIGVPLIYTSESVAVAALEVLANFPMNIPVSDYRLVTFEVPEGVSMKTMTVQELQAGWDDPLPHPSTVEIGRGWVMSAASLVLRVPSAVLHGNGWNLLLNPAHLEFGLVQLVDNSPFAFDRRLVG